MRSVPPRGWVRPAVAHDSLSCAAKPTRVVVLTSWDRHSWTGEEYGPTNGSLAAYLRINLCFNCTGKI
jgi:hypothetical protein